MTVDALTKFYVDFYDSTKVEVTIELDERGLLHVSVNPRRPFESVQHHVRN